MAICGLQFFSSILVLGEQLRVKQYKGGGMRGAAAALSFIDSLQEGMC